MRPEQELAGAAKEAGGDVSSSEDMLSMVWYDCMLTHLRASPLEVSPANQDISKANNGNAGDAASPAGGQIM
jgi:hypothetical protein